tara:strand:- start:655 stop:855 length:201 start_codon:yes stop_codon:yes gene_type:complete
MKTLERQILASLDRLHRDEADAGPEPCRWNYNGARDIYSCPHITLSGKAVIGRVETMNQYTISTVE